MTNLIQSTAGVHHRTSCSSCNILLCSCESLINYTHIYWPSVRPSVCPLTARVLRPQQINPVHGSDTILFTVSFLHVDGNPSGTVGKLCHIIQRCLQGRISLIALPPTSCLLETRHISLDLYMTWTWLS